MIQKLQKWIELASRWKNLSFIFALLAALLSVLLKSQQFPVLERIDIVAQDYAVSLREPIKPHPVVTIVAVDEKSIKKYGRWPWPRTLQAKLITQLKAYQVGVIGFDIIYLRPESEAADRALIDAIRAPGTPIVGGYFFREQQTIGGGDLALSTLAKNKITVIKTQDDTEFPFELESYNYVETNQNSISKPMQALGFFNVFPDSDKLVRHAQLLIHYEGNYYPSLPLKTLEYYCKMQISAVFMENGVSHLNLASGHGEQGVCDTLFSDEQSVPYTIPLNIRGAHHLDFYWSNQDETAKIKIHSAADVLDNSLPKSALKNKILFLGVTEVGISDLKATPVDDSFPGVAVHATVVSNVLQNRYFQSATPAIELLNYAMIIIIPIFIILVMSRLQKGFYLLLFFALVMLMAWFLFRLSISAHLLVSIIYPIISIIGTFFIVQVYYIITTQKHAKFLKGSFSSYVSPNVVNTLIKNPDAFDLKGHKRNISILFSDIRGFTTLSESLPPEKLVVILNEYLGPMTDIVMEYEGTLDKYIGDAVMALYNAPIDLKNHADAATFSALDMLRDLKTLNIDFKLKYNIELKIGIGIHTGDAITGNMGSSKRFDYTAIGDSVNLAARVEGQTKAYGVELIVTEATLKQFQHQFIYRKLDKLKVRGKFKPVEIFEVMSAEPDATLEKLARLFNAALDNYFAGYFESGMDNFINILHHYPEDKATKIMLMRCKQFMLNPPENWDGVYIATSK